MLHHSLATKLALKTHSYEARWQASRSDSLVNQRPDFWRKKKLAKEETNLSPIFQVQPKE